MHMLFCVWHFVPSIRHLFIFDMKETLALTGTRKKVIVGAYKCFHAVLLL